MQFIIAAISRIIMRVWILAVFVAILGVAFAEFKDLKDGRPGCNTDKELQTIYYRNLWDPTAYWKCERRGVAASVVRCNEGAYQSKLNKCVSWDDWEWEDPVAPPSSA